MRKKILIFGHYGVPNWGDEAILKGILSQIDFRKFCVTVVTDDKKFTKKHHGVKGIFPPAFGIRSFFRGGFLEIFSSIKASDFIIFGGGGLFQDNPPQALKIWSYYLRICQILFPKKKIFLLGNSFESLKNNNNISALKKILSKVKFFSVRDRSSFQWVEKNISPHSPTLVQTSDSAYFLEPNAKPGRKSGLLLAMREGDIDEKKEKKILKILKEFFPKEFTSNTVQVLIMQEKNSGDKKFGFRHSLPLFSPQSLDELQAKVRSSKAVITSRLHAGILANLSNTPFIALSPREKITEFFGENFAFSLQKIFTKKGEKQFRETLKNILQLKAGQKNFMISQKKKLENFFPSILQ